MDLQLDGLRTLRIRQPSEEAERTMWKVYTTTPNVTVWEAAQQRWHSIPDKLMDPGMFQDLSRDIDERYIDEKVCTLLQGDVRVCGGLGDSPAFLFKFLGDVTCSSHSLALLFHPQQIASEEHPQQTFGAVISTEGIWAKWMTSQQDTLKPVFHNKFTKFVAGPGWYYVSFDYDDEDLTFKIIQTESPAYVGGRSLMFHPDTDEYKNHSGMMITLLAERGVTMFLEVDDGWRAP
jgi:hypothetical protein